MPTSAQAEPTVWPLAMALQKRALPIGRPAVIPLRAIGDRRQGGGGVCDGVP